MAAPSLIESHLMLAFRKVALGLLIVSAIWLPARARAQAEQRSSVRAWCEPAGGWIEARDDEIWLVAEGRVNRRMLRMRSRIIDVSVSTGRRPLVAIALSGTPSRAVVVARFTPASRRSRQSLRILGGGVEPHRRPWRVSWGDVDGDGREDLLVGVIGRARFDPTDRKRPFVYTWDGRRLVPKWLGSRLSRPFIDAVLGNADDAGPADLVALESTRDGGLEIAVYAWKGFGFERRFASSRITAPASVGRSRDGRILLDTEGQSSVITIDGIRVLLTPRESP